MPNYLFVSHRNMSLIALADVEKYVVNNLKPLLGCRARFMQAKSVDIRVVATYTSGAVEGEFTVALRGLRSEFVVYVYAQVERRDSETLEVSLTGRSVLPKFAWKGILPSSRMAEVKIPMSQYSLYSRVF